MKRIVKALGGLMAVCALVLCCACSQQAASSSSSAAEPAPTQQKQTVNVMALNGPTGIGMAKLSQDDAYNVRFVGATDEVVSAISSGSVEIAAIPTNLAAALYNKTQGGVELVAVDTYGTLYLLENGNSIASLEDLAGKHVYATGAGANPQFILEHLLSLAGLEAGTSVEVEYLPEHSELAALAANGEAGVALLPEPFVSVAQAKGSQDLRVALDMGAEWKARTGSDLAMGCVIVRKEFAEQHPEAVEQFVKDLGTSVEFANADVDGAAQLCADLGILPNANVAKSAIPKCSLVCVTGQEAQKAVDGYLKVLYDAKPQSVGGALPAQDFYYAG